MATTIIIPRTDPRIFYHGRWDASPTTWWAASGFKLHVRNLRSLSLNLGPDTSKPSADVGVSLNYRPFVTIHASAGTNVVPLGDDDDAETSMVRINVQRPENNRIHLESIGLNTDATLLPYEPLSLSFLFIGDSFSLGYNLPLGVNQSWPSLVAQHFKVEHIILAQTGVTLADLPAFGNAHGMSFQFFQTEDPVYQGQNTPWDFSRDKPTPTHIVIYLGANDIGMDITDAQFIETYTAFLTRMRTVYPDQPIFVFAPWGVPTEQGTISMYGYYLTDVYRGLVDSFRSKGDTNVFLVDAMNWITSVSDLIPKDEHLNVSGNERVAERFAGWLEEWGVKHSERWPSQGA